MSLLAKCQTPHWAWMMAPMCIYMFCLILLSIAKLEFFSVMLCRAANVDTTVCADKLPDYAAEASMWNLYVALANTMPSLFSASVYGGLSDHMGRKPLLLVAIVGSIVYSGSYLAVYYLRASNPLLWLCLAGAFSGLCGDFPTIIMAMFSYVADVTTTEERTFKYGLIDLMLYVGSLGSGIVAATINSENSQMPFVLITAAMAALLIYFALTPESLSKERRTPTFSLRKSNVVSVLSLFFKPRAGGRTPMLLVAFAFLTFMICISGLQAIQFLWLSLKLGWDVKTYGIYSSNSWLARIVALGLTYGLVFNLPFLKSRINDMHVMIAGNVLTVIGMAATTFATSTAFVYVAVAPLCFAAVVAPSFRAYFSRAVSPRDQGSMMAGVGAIEALAIMLGPVCFNPLFSFTADSLPDVSMQTLTGVQLACLLATCALPWAIARGGQENLLATTHGTHQRLPSHASDDEDEDRAIGTPFQDPV